MRVPPTRGVVPSGSLPARRATGMLGEVSSLSDTARFRADDPDELVIASLACPLCLHGDDVQWELEADGYDPSAQCLCRRCEEPWRVYMTPYQALRLALMVVRAG
jgi:hypothetical protein